MKCATCHGLGTEKPPCPECGCRCHRVELTSGVFETFRVLDCPNGGEERLRDEATFGS